MALRMNAGIVLRHRRLTNSVHCQSRRHNDRVRSSLVWPAASTACDELPPGFTYQRLAARRYAVFRHAGHISSIHETFAAIFQRWLPASGLQAADAPEFERYSADFDPMAGKGQVDIWVPLRD